MQIGYLIGSIVVGLLSLICIGSTVYEVAIGKYAIMTGNFWGAAVFHGITAVVAVWLLLKAVGKG